VTRAEFEADLLREGYEVFYGGSRANEVLPEHGHDREERSMMIGGEMTLTRDGKPERFDPDGFGPLQLPPDPTRLVTWVTICSLMLDRCAIRLLGGSSDV
jgi:hypothetical protein